ncbi:hypothetical protein OB905_13215 [Halobacteria archaeon AArc-dxtr1]|nr:hypothetical protein [Halobacteria archaeon AArc-dxtr1]
MSIAHREVRTWRWLVWLLVPALPLHELTHAIVAKPWADVEIDWHHPMVIMHWDDAPPWAILCAHVAPLLIGCLVGSAALFAFAIGFVPELHFLVWVWLLGNWFNYTALTLQDLRVFS